MSEERRPAPPQPRPTPPQPRPTPQPRQAPPGEGLERKGAPRPPRRS